MLLTMPILLGANGATTFAPSVASTSLATSNKVCIQPYYKRYLISVRSFLPFHMKKRCAARTGKDVY